jgi:hypothetical protein
MDGPPFSQNHSSLFEICLNNLKSSMFIRARPTPFPSLANPRMPHASLPRTLPLPAGPRSPVTRRRSPLCGHARRPSCPPLVGDRDPPSSSPSTHRSTSPNPPFAASPLPPLKGCRRRRRPDFSHPRHVFFSPLMPHPQSPPSPLPLAIGSPLRTLPPRQSRPPPERRYAGRSPPPHRRPTSSVSPASTLLAQRIHRMVVEL